MTGQSSRNEYRDSPIGHCEACGADESSDGAFCRSCGMYYADKWEKAKRSSLANLRWILRIVAWLLLSVPAGWLLAGLISNPTLVWSMITIRGCPKTC